MSHEVNDARFQAVRDAVLAACWEGEGFFAKYRKILNECLFDGRIELYEHIEAGKPKNVVELSTIFGLYGGNVEASRFINSMFSITGNETSYITELWEFYFQRGVSLKGINRQKVKRMEEIYAEIERMSKNETGNVIEAVTEFEETREKIIKNGGKLGMATKYPELDELTMGGLVPGMVTVIGGFSNSGKSKFTYSILPKLLDEGKKVAYFTLEITKDFLLANVYASKFGRRVDELFASGLPEWDAIAHLSVYSGLFDVTSVTKEIGDKSFDVAFIDFVQLMRADGESEVQQYKNVAYKLQECAIHTKCHIIEVSQVPAASRLESGMNQALKGSNAFREAASTVLMISRNNDQLNEHGVPSTELVISKNRYGRVGDKFTLGGDFATGNLTLKKFDF